MSKLRGKNGDILKYAKIHTRYSYQNNYIIRFLYIHLKIKEEEAYLHSVSKYQLSEYNQNQTMCIRTGGRANNDYQIYSYLWQLHIGLKLNFTKINFGQIYEIIKLKYISMQLKLIQNFA